jgi:hypothetical protein
VNAWIIGTAIAATLAGSPAPPKTDEAPPIVGSWRLVSCERRAPSGETAHPFGNPPQGQLIYTIEGRVSVHLADPTRPRFASGEFLEGSEDEVRTAFERSFSYFGTYTLEGSGAKGTVIHHVEGSAFPNYAGIDRIWTVTIDGRHLTLETARPPEGASTFRVVWERVP